MAVNRRLPERRKEATVAQTSSPTKVTNEFEQLADDAVALVHRWLTEADGIAVSSSASRLAGVLKDTNGLPFTVGFVDGVVRPEDLRVAAKNLKALASLTPRFLPWHLRTAIRLGAAFAPILPGIVVPIARTVLRRMVGHLIIDATDRKLGKAIGRIRAADVRLNLNLLGEAVLGDREAGRRLEGTRKLLARDDVDYVSIKVSATTAPHTSWAFDESVDHVVDRLGPLFELAAASSTPKFINLDMEEYKDLDFTIAVFTKILSAPHLAQLSAGIVLQTYLPDALSAMMRLQEWSAQRRASGGADIKVRIVKGANLPMEQVEASLHDWPLATWSTKQETDTNYKRVLDYALTPEHIENVRIGVAGHNLFDIASAWLLAGRRGVQHGIEFEMLLGMAQAQAEVVKREVGEILLYTPVVHPAEFDVAIAYLIRRLEEGASQDNFMSAVFELSSSQPLFDREEQRFRRSVDDLDSSIPTPRRTQNRNLAETGPIDDTFSNTPDTDSSLPANREWGRSILSRVPTSKLGERASGVAKVSTPKALDEVLRAATKPTNPWHAMSGKQRGDVLRRAARALENHRADLIEVMASEAGKTIDQADPEVSEAVDFANYYAQLAEQLDTVDGAKFHPVGATVVTPPWNFPVAIPAGSTLAALAAGSSVIIKPAALAFRCGAVMVEALWEAGVPKDALQLVRLTERSLGSQLISDPRVGRVILTGGYETAELFRGFRNDLPLLAETSGKNAIIVTPSADLDLAARDVVNSAFGHAGQKCSAASLVILVGTAGTSARFRNQLVDAVRSLAVAYPTDPTAQMGPIIEPANGKLLSALTTLEPGQSWLVEPKKLDDTGMLWSPGVRAGVKRGSEFHLTEYFGPVLGVMTAATLEEALIMQNEVDYGLTAGLHSLDPDEIALWIDTVQAGNLYVNRGTTGAIVRRQPFGGWKKSAVGAGTKAGGPNYLIGLGDWTSTTASAPSVDLADTPAHLLEAAAKSGISKDELDFLRRAMNSDAQAWTNEFGTASDISALSAERNVFRYRPVPVQVRLADGQDLSQLVRVLAAGAVAGSAVSVSVPDELPSALAEAVRAAGMGMAVETDDAWLTRLAAGGGGRLRLIGGDVTAVAKAVGGRPDLAIYSQPVTESGRIELLPFLREQAVSITAHRFGSPNHLSDHAI
jgi:RHH-type proline utilization regulon transcriptional repressor/proline dehydrogenase/delta 1-pyrroline-5-carboxylate dehydrogenase